MLSEKRKKWNQENTKKCNDYVKKYHSTHKEKIRKYRVPYRRQYYKQYKEEISAQQNEYRRNKKKRAVALLGGKCQICGYNRYLGALEFHHAAGEKDPKLSNLLDHAWKFIEEELKECVLLCANCHREVHAGIA